MSSRSSTPIRSLEPKPPISFLGAGGAHDVHLGNSAALLTWEGETFLIDCGFTVYPRLVQKNLVEKPQAILITHLHDDHIGSLSALLYHRHFLSKLPPTPLLAGTPELRQKLHTYLTYLMGELMERFATILAPEAYRPYLKSFDTSGLHMPHMPSAAYLFTSPSLNLLYSGDIGKPVPALPSLATLPTLWVFHDLAFHRTPTHAHYTELIPFYEQGYNLWGYHCDPAQAPPDNPIPLVHSTFLLG